MNLDSEIFLDILYQDLFDTAKDVSKNKSGERLESIREYLLRLERLLHLSSMPKRNSNGYKRTELLKKLYYAK